MVDDHTLEKISLWKKNITLDYEVDSGDILFPECDIFPSCGNLP